MFAATTAEAALRQPHGARPPGTRAEAGRARHRADLGAFRWADMTFGPGYGHWFFYAQPHDMPERFLPMDSNPYFLKVRWHLFASEAFEEYLRCFCD